MSFGRAATERRTLRGIAGHLAAWLRLIVRPRRFKESRLLPPRRRLALGALAGSALVAFAMIVVDARTVNFARDLPPWLVDTFNEITDYGKSGWFLIPLAAVVITAAIFAPIAGRFANLVLTSIMVRCLYLFFAIAVPGLAVTIAKGFIGRARPSSTGPSAYMPWTWQHEFASFPSGHSTTAFAAAAAIAALFPRMRIPMLIFAVTIAMSRVVITTHFVSDVVAAAFVGTFGAVLVRNWFAARSLVFVPEVDGVVHARPGPSWRRVKAVARALFGQ
jgi:undecaprenyl-diphosphatase